MSDQKAFISLSSALTGLSPVEIPAEVDQQDATGGTIKLADVYLQRLRSAYPVEFGELLATWRALQLDPDASKKLEAKLMAADDGGQKLRVAARQVIKIWFLSTIDDPLVALGKDGKSATQLGGDLGQFQNSAIWKLIGAPVQGYSFFPHGYWANKP